jgi:hypothetical protein
MADKAPKFKKAPKPASDSTGKFFSKFKKTQSFKKALRQVEKKGVITSLDTAGRAAIYLSNKTKKASNKKNQLNTQKKQKKNAIKFEQKRKLENYTKKSKEKIKSQQDKIKNKVRKKIEPKKKKLNNNIELLKLKKQQLLQKINNDPSIKFKGFFRKKLRNPEEINSVKQQRKAEIETKFNSKIQAKQEAILGLEQSEGKEINTKIQQSKKIQKIEAKFKRKSGIVTQKSNTLEKKINAKYDPKIKALTSKLKKYDGNMLKITLASSGLSKEEIKNLENMKNHPAAKEIIKGLTNLLVQREKDIQGLKKLNGKKRSRSQLYEIQQKNKAGTNNEGYIKGLLNRVSSERSSLKESMKNLLKPKENTQMQPKANEISSNFSKVLKYGETLKATSKEEEEKQQSKEAQQSKEEQKPQVTAETPKEEQPKTKEEQPKTKEAPPIPPKSNAVKVNQIKTLLNATSKSSNNNIVKQLPETLKVENIMKLSSVLAKLNQYPQLKQSVKEKTENLITKQQDIVNTMKLPVYKFILMKLFKISNEVADKIIKEDLESSQKELNNLVSARSKIKIRNNRREILEKRRQKLEQKRIDNIRNITVVGNGEGFANLSANTSKTNMLY